MTEELIKRQDVPKEYRWNVEALYATDEAWEADYQAAKKLPEQVASYEGRLHESAEVLAEALTTWFNANRQMEKVYTYAHLRSDEDLGNSRYQEMVERVRAYIGWTQRVIPLAGNPEHRRQVIVEWMQATLKPTNSSWRICCAASPMLSPPRRLVSMVSDPPAAIHSIFSVLNVNMAARTQGQGRAIRQRPAPPSNARRP